jgi:putative MATE family efflux protein
MTTNLTEGKIITHIKSIAIPASVGMLFNTLFNVVDTFYSGKISTDALAGLTVSFPIFFIIIAISVGIGSGTTALSAIALGTNDIKTFHKLIRNSLILGFFLMIIIILAAPATSNFLFKLSGVKGETLIAGTNYMNTLFFGSGFFIFNFILNGALTAQGDTKSYRNFLIIGFFLNLILDPMFIYGWLLFPKLGTIGIALATVIVQVIGTIYLLYKVYKSPLFEILTFKSSTFSMHSIIALLKQGIPTSLNMATIALGVFIINFFILRFSDDITIAAFGAAVRVEQLALLPALGLNTAALTITGQNFGAKDIERIYDLRKQTLIIGVGIMVIGAIIIYPLAPWLIGLFNKDPSVITAGTNYLRIEVFAFPTYVIIGILLSIMQGIKKPTFAVYLGLYRQILMPIPLFYFFGIVLDLGVNGIWWGIVFVTWTSVLAAHLYSRKQLKNLVPSLGSLR